MVRSRRSISKEDASSLLADSGVSLSSPPATNGNAALSSNADVDEINNGNEGGDNDDDEDEEENDDDENEDDEDYEEDDDDDFADADFDLASEIALAKKSKTKVKTYAAASRSTKSTSSKSKQLFKATALPPPAAAPPIPASTAPSPPLSSGVATKVAAATAAPPAAKKARKTHTCAVCDKEFGGKTDLKRHMLIHSNERPHKCEQCGKSYRQAVNLKNHITSAHKGQKQFQCVQCPKAFALKERLRLHMRLHSGDKPYACELCDKRFARGGQLLQHRLSYHKDNTTKRFNCEICSSGFSTAGNLRAHMERHEQGPDHFCEICKEHFSNDAILRAHINKIHFKLKQFDCEICKTTIEEGDFADHMKTHAHLKTHICLVCQAFFTQKSQYNVHMRMHTGERPHQCRICWQTFAHSSVLKLHIRKHTGEKPFQCLLCKDDEVAFSQLAHLKTHMKKIHRQSNPYMCTGCGEFFKIKAELQSHMSKCVRCVVDNVAQSVEQQDQQTLSHLRFHVALLLKKISSDQKLHQLGYEKRLIDNVVIASLKLANRKAYDDHKLSAIERMRLNVEEFLNWIVPAKVMEQFKQQSLSVECILDKIVTMYMKQK